MPKFQHFERILILQTKNHILPFRGFRAIILESLYLETGSHKTEV